MAKSDVDAAPTVEWPRKAAAAAGRGECEDFSSCSSFSSCPADEEEEGEEEEKDDADDDWSCVDLRTRFAAVFSLPLG